MKKIIIGLTLLMIVPSYCHAQEPIQKKINPVTVLVMPYDRYERYPYNMDLIREFLQLALREKGFTIVEDEGSWESILEKDYPLYNLSQEQAETIINDVDADLIVYGYADNWNSSRMNGIYNERKVARPILIKVYDKKKQSIVLHERIDFYEYWGLFVKQHDLSSFGIQIAYKLKQIGY